MGQPNDQTTHDAPPRSWARTGSWRAILALAGVALAARLLYLALLCPYTLVEDEAHYWEWSRHLDWSYYSKGPGVAWTIAATTRLLGDTEFGVRAGAPLFASILIIGVAGLATDVARDARAGFVAGVLTLVAPIYAATALLMTIDMPYVAMWALAAWAAWRAIARGSRPAWLALGAAVGVGFLFKYTILLLLPGLALFVLVDRAARARIARRWPWALASVGVMALGLLPVLAWNAAHDWVTVRHLLGHLGLAAGDMPVGDARTWRWNPSWTLELVLGQAGLMALPLLLCAEAVVVAARRRRTEPDRWPGRLYLICCAAPVLVFYLGVTLFTRAEGNWPMAGYATLLALAGWAVIDAMDDRTRRLRAWRARPPAERPREGILRRQPELHRQIAWHWSIALGILVTLGVARIDLVARLPLVGPLVPITRLTGARALAADVAALRQRLDDDPALNPDHLDPLVIAQHYGRASLLAFYLPGRPTVYCSSAAMGGRRTQYDEWPDTDLADPALRGRPGVLLGATPDDWAPAFDRVEGPVPLEHEPKGDRRTFLGGGYRGFPMEDDP